MIRRLLFIGLLCACAQQLPGYTTGYLGYHATIALAEAELSSGRYDAALRRYDSAFSAFEFSMPGDCYAAAQLSAFSGDTAGALRHMKRGIVFGLPVSVIRGNPRLKPLISTDLLPATVLDSCMTAYRSRIDPRARREAIALARADQRLIHDPVLTKGQSIYTRNGDLKPELKPTWDSLLRELVRITDAYGFPAERIAGTHAAADSLFAENISTRYGMQLLIHHGQAWPLLKDRLYAELERGNISPRLYGGIAEYANRGLPAVVPYRAMLSCEYDYHVKQCKQTVRKRLQEVDSARAAIGLCSYEVLMRKEELKRLYRNWAASGAGGNPPVFDFIGVGWEGG